MKTTATMYLRAFTVRIQDQRTGETSEDVIVFDKAQLQAAQVIGQSSKELIFRAYNEKGYTVLDIGKADKQEIELDLYGLYQGAVGDGLRSKIFPLRYPKMAAFAAGDTRIGTESSQRSLITPRPAAGRRAPTRPPSPLWKPH